jgi:uracil-DNA glycosylase family 4
LLDGVNHDLLLKNALHVNSLDEWRELCLNCRRCPLRKGATNVVFGEGDPHAGIMFIGEGPGGEEDKMGRPFVGAAGRLLDRIIAAAGWKREEVYIANIVKCRPPGNRNPLQDEIEICYPLLEKQIELIDPQIIVTLGAVSAKVLLGSPNLYITKERGKWHQFGSRMLMPTFHPAALLRDPAKKRPVWEDIKQVVALYSEINPKGN